MINTHISKCEGNDCEVIVHMTAQVDASTKPTMHADLLNRKSENTICEESLFLVEVFSS